MESEFCRVVNPNKLPFKSPLLGGRVVSEVSVNKRIFRIMFMIGDSMLEHHRAEGVKKRVAAYCRVSTDRDDQANSFASQQKYFQQYIERTPEWELYRVFADEGISGTSTKNRRGFKLMIAEAKEGRFDLVITKEISRFARNTLDSVYYTRELKRHGVGVIFLNDNINTLEPDAELRLTIMSSIAQEESRKTSERVKWGQKRRMEQGVVFGRNLLGYDVHGGKLYVNEAGAKIVRLIFQKFVQENKGAHVIARELTEAKVPTANQAKEWSSTTVLRILRNEKYCGDLVQKKTYTPDYLSHEKKYNRGEEEFVVIHNHHEPIIARATFEQAKALLDSRAQNQAGQGKYSRCYCFSGKIKCGRCGASYVARRKTRKDGSQYVAWCCYQSRKYGRPHLDAKGEAVGCLPMSIRDDDAQYIMSLVCQDLAKGGKKIIEGLIRVIRQALQREQRLESNSEHQLQRQVLQAKQERALDLYISGELTKEEFQAARQKYAAAMSSLEVSGSESASAAQGKCLWDEARIAQAIADILVNGGKDGQFYREILASLIVHNRDQIDVHLQHLPVKWSYTSTGFANNDNIESQGGISDNDIPISVIAPLTLL